MLWVAWRSLTLGASRAARSRPWPAGSHRPISAGRARGHRRSSRGRPRSPRLRPASGPCARRAPLRQCLRMRSPAPRRQRGRCQGRRLCGREISCRTSSGSSARSRTRRRGWRSGSSSQPVMWVAISESWLSQTHSRVRTFSRTVPPSSWTCTTKVARRVAMRRVSRGPVMRRQRGGNEVTVQPARAPGHGAVVRSPGGEPLEFRILGPLEVCSQGHPVPLRGPRQRALLAILLLHAGEVVSTERLIDLLWGERTARGRRARHCRYASHNSASCWSRPVRRKRS